jgi:hypothetical protein
VVVHALDGKNMLEKPSEPGIVGRAHTITFAIQAVIAAAVIVGYIGSLVAHAYGDLSFGFTVLLAAILALVVTQLPVAVPWGRRYFLMWRSQYPWISTALAFLIVALVLVHDNLHGATSGTGPAGPKGEQGIQGPPGPPGVGQPDPRIDGLIDRV